MAVHPRSTPNLPTDPADLGVTGDVDRPAELEHARRLAERYRLEFVDMDTFRIDQDLFRSIPADLMLRYGFVPNRRTGKTLEIVVSDPTDLPMIDELAVVLSTPIKVAVGPRSAIESILKKSESSQRVLEEATETFHLQLLKDDDSGDDNLTVERLTSDINPVIKLVDSTIYTAIQRRASDIHIETQDDAVHVKYRIDGVLQPAMRPIAKQFHSPIISRIKVMAELDIAEKRVPQDGRFKLRMPGKTIDFRVSIMPSVHGEDAVIRILDKESLSEQFTELRLDILGFPAAELKRFRKYIAEPYGMVLVTGPTGSGKTTTLYAALSEIRSIEDKIITIEPPPRPGQDHGRRDPRRRNGADRHQLRVDRPPGVHDRARQQRAGRARPLSQHGRGGVSVRISAQLRAGAAAGAHHLHPLQAARQGDAGVARGIGSGHGARTHADVLRRDRLHRMQRHGLQGPDGDLRAARPLGPHPGDDSREAGHLGNQESRARRRHAVSPRIGGRAGHVGDDDAARDQQGHIRRMSILSSLQEATPPSVAVELAANRVSAAAIGLRAGKPVVSAHA